MELLLIIVVCVFGLVAFGDVGERKDWPDFEDDLERVSTGDRICSDCGADNPPWFADNELWNSVMGGPDCKDDPGGVVCPTCFVVRSGETLRITTSAKEESHEQ